MDIKEFDSLITEFKNTAGTAKSELTHAVSLLSEGKIPDPLLRQKIDESLDDLQKKYWNIYNEMKNFVTNIECPDRDSGVESFSEAFKRSEKLRIRNEVEAAKSTIEKFLRVTSSVDAYLKALKPYQENARKILEDIMTNIDNDEIGNEIQKEQIFLRALEEELDNKEVDELFDLISEHYSPKVQTGLAFKRYFIGEEIADTKDKSELQAKPVGNNEGIGTGTGQKEVIHNAPHYTAVKGRLKRGKPYATTFVNDMNGNNRNVFEKKVANVSKDLLHLGIRFSVFSQKLAELDLIAAHNRGKGYHDIDRALAIIPSALSELKKKGYILEYEPTFLDEPVYCLSPLTESCLKKKTVRDLFADIDWSSSWCYIGREQVPENILKKIYRTNMLLFQYISQDNSLWYGDKELNLGRSVTVLKSSGDEDAEIIDCQVYDYFDLYTGGQTVNCVLDNGYLPGDLPADVSVLVYDRKYESVHLGNPVYYFDEIEVKKADVAENLEEAVKSDDISEAKSLSLADGVESSAANISVGESSKQENTKGTEPQLPAIAKPGLAAKKALPETDLNEPAQEMPKFIYAKSKLNLGRADAVQFVKDLTRKNSMNLFSSDSTWIRRLIIEFGVEFGVLTADMVFQLIISLDHDGEDRMKATQDISLALSELVRNGYVIEYELSNNGESAYCLSPLTEACLKKKAAGEIKWNYKNTPKPLFVGAEKIFTETINRFLLNNRLYSQYFNYCKNNEIEVSLRSFKRFLAEPTEEASGLSGLFVFDKIDVCVNGKEISCYIDSGNFNLLNLKPENVLVVDKRYNSSPAGTNVYYLDDLDKKMISENKNKKKTDKPDITAKSEPAVPKPKPDKLDLSGVNNPVSNILKPKRGDKRKNGVESKAPAPVRKKPEKAEPMTLVSKPAESKQVKMDKVVIVTQSPETVDQVKQDSVPETHDRFETLVTQGPLSAERTVTDNYEMLLDRKEALSDEEFYQIILSLLSGNNTAVFSSDSYVAQALLMAKAAAGISNNTKCRKLYEQLLLATRLSLDTLRYTSEWLEETYSDDNETLKSARLASYIQALVRPDRAYDSGLKSKCYSILQNFEEEFPSFLEVKQLFSELTLIEKTLPSGFSDSVLAYLGDAASKDKYVADLQKSATAYLKVPQGRSGIRQLSRFYELSMGNNSDICQALTTIAENNVKNLDVVKVCLNYYCTEKDGVFSIDQNMVDTQIDNFWSEAVGKDKYVLDFTARSRADNRFKERIQLMKDWAEYADSMSVGGSDIDKVRKLRNKILKAATTAKNALLISSDAEKNLLAWVVNSLLEFFHKGNKRDIRTFTELLYTGVISLDDNGIPVIDDKWNQIRYYEPWRLVLRHIVSLKNEENKALDNVKTEIFDNSSPIYDNLQQLKLIGRFTDNEEDIRYASSEKNINDARKSADDRLKKFCSTLELSFTYGRISEDEKETILGSAVQFKPDFYRIMDFGIWGQFLAVLYKRINEAADVRKRELRNQLQARFDKYANNEESNSYDREPPAILTAAKRLLENENNFAVTEEYINQFDNGNIEATSEELETALHDPDSFEDFLDDRSFKSIYSECKKQKGGAFAKFATKYCEKHYPKGWSPKYQDSCNKLISYWPKGGNTNGGQIVNLFRSFGFRAESAVQNNNYREAVFELKISSTDKSMPDYPHPISKFGTLMKSPINVVILAGSVEAKQLTDTMTRLNLGELTIVLVDGFIDLGKRRQIAEEFHGTSGQNSFIFIDWILAIFLALHQDAERLPVLLKCTLPFTSYQPFVCGGGATADEMFCGRSVELASLINPNGACVVYGGRQLGKTALLERTASRCHKPQNKAYAVYSNINNCTSEKALVKKLSNDIVSNTNLPKLKSDSLESFCNDIQRLFNSRKIVSMHLLMDEADDYLESIADDNYIALQPLIDLKRKTTNNFKFVLAGLHNVCRAKNATKNNGVFGQIGEPLCIKPLSPTDALQLLSRPLRYLGFQIDRYPHLETILTQTNYYPGILQFFGYKLVENLTMNYSKYYRAANGNPPFKLKDDLLGELISSTDLNKSIAEKFRLSLDLDERYFMIARCIALLHYEQDEKKLNWMGYKVGDIISTARFFDIHCLEDLSRDAYILLMDEMVDMGILSRPEPGYYRMRRSSFIQIIGPNYDAVFEEIDNKNGGTKE